MALYGTVLGRLAFSVSAALRPCGLLAVGIDVIGEEASPVRQEPPGALTAADAAADSAAPHRRALAVGL